ncbi:hypothetical protein ABH922_002421 [Rhodococcus sp. 27YEA15]|uniref:hypothetical protein n=1 Tax=Rhodococcus sp. 27YEA15 TaxID=3156259 RepID=UPI003C7D4EA0
MWAVKSAQAGDRSIGGGVIAESVLGRVLVYLRRGETVVPERSADGMRALAK